VKQIVKNESNSVNFIFDQINWSNFLPKSDHLQVRDIPGRRTSLCVFNGVTIGQNDTVTIQTNPQNLDANTIAGVAFTQSSIYSIPVEIFTRFPNIFVVQAYDQNLREIEADTFRNGKNIRMLELGKNKLIHLHVDSFRGGFLFYY
jgi:hypothetical protein